MSPVASRHVATVVVRFVGVGRSTEVPVHKI